MPDMCAMTALEIASTWVADTMPRGGHAGNHGGNPKAVCSPEDIHAHVWTGHEKAADPLGKLESGYSEPLRGNTACQECIENVLCP